MKTELLKPTQANLERAAQALRNGELVAFPTETVYGLGASALDDAAVQSVFVAKGRPLAHPLIVHLKEGSDISDWSRASGTALEMARQLAEAFWPGPLTLVLPRSAAVSELVTGAQPTVALRVPAHPVAQALLEQSDLPLVAPSANRYGRLSPTLAQHVTAQLDGRVRFVLDGGPCEIGLESTILDLSGPSPRVLRPGQLSAGRLAEVLGVPVGGRGAARVPRVPGSTASHYAPRAGTRLVSGVGLPQAAALSVGATAVLSFQATPAGFTGSWLTMPQEPVAYARELYSRLHELDRSAELILIEQPPETPAWEAVNDRLRRAAGERQRNSDQEGER